MKPSIDNMTSTSDFKNTSIGLPDKELANADDQTAFKVAPLFQTVAKPHNL